MLWSRSIKCDATGLGERVRGDLGAGGGRPPRLELSGVDALTPAERRVCGLAAGELTNRQIAQTLFVTEKTDRAPPDERLPQARHPLALPAGRGDRPLTLGESLGSFPLCGPAPGCRLFACTRSEEADDWSALPPQVVLCSKHWKLVIAAWMVVALGLALAGRAAGDRTSDNLRLPGTGSTQATDLLEARLPSQANGTNPLVIKSSQGKLTDDKNTKAVNKTVDELRKTPHVTRRSTRSAITERRSCPRTRRPLTSR